MKIAVASDAHGANRMIERLLEDLPPVDALCFLGDMDKDAEYLDYGLAEKQPRATLYAVAGNNDPFSEHPRTVEIVEGDLRVLVTHGHLYHGIRFTRSALAKAAAEMRCTLALYGHTHVQKDETKSGVRLINPGALMQGHWALVNIDGSGIDVEMMTLTL